MGAGGRMVGLVKAIPRSHENRPRPCGLARRNIQPPITHHHGAVGIEIHLAACLFDQAWAWFPAAALLAVFRNNRVRVVGAEVIRVNAGIPARETRIKRIVHLVKKGLIDESPSDP